MKIAKSSLHFIGIGGIGMCGLAELLHNLGAEVTGSDMTTNQQTERLRNLGVKVSIGHRAEQVPNVDVVVYSSAVQDDNVELAAARNRKIPTIPRAEVLAEIMRLKRGIAVGGTHGKTTTTSLLASIFLKAKVDPTIVVGGRLDAIKSTAVLGQGEWLIAEADESDGSFLKLSPEIAIITNIDNDHLDHYGTFEALQNGFLAFAYRVPFYGSVVACGDDPRLFKLLQGFRKKVVFYGFEAHNDARLTGERGRYQIYFRNQTLGEFVMASPGRHLALNATAAVVCALEAGIDLESCRRGIAEFQGVDRRFQLLGAAGGVAFYDDYGHHPTEIRATLQAFREKFPGRRLVVVFQPHRYSRTELCWEEFKTCFEECDELFLADIYPAGEPPRDGITSFRLAQDLTKKSRLIGKALEGAELVSQALRDEDIVVTLGAGDVSKLGPLLIAARQTGK